MSKRQNQQIEAVGQLLHTPKNIVITMHKNPDGDAIGSAIGLAKFLQKQHHHIMIISPNKYPAYLAWMIDAQSKIFVYEEDNQPELKKRIEQADIIFCLDFSNLSRIEPMSLAVQKSQATKIIIDHHHDPQDFAQICICDPNASSTTLLIYKMIIAFEQASLIDKQIATCLYTGILTDTGSFHNSGTHPDTHLVVAKLLEKGVDISEINKNMRKNGTIENLHFLAHAITHRLHIIPNSRTAYFAIEKNDYEKFNLKPTDTQLLTNYPLSIEGIDCAVLLTEYDHEIRLSFRSVGDLAVNKIAKYFNGGGHKNAAGGTYKEETAEGMKQASLQKATKLLIEKITEARC
ncbi:MAG: bifunctional oligoribonuclease/PAP phosphatase NrnA [Bacteroidota bacterium]